MLRFVHYTEVSGFIGGARFRERELSVIADPEKKIPFARCQLAPMDRVRARDVLVDLPFK
jgi:hypothetical protein